ncbi:hypothetical protein Cni_G11709 [Canna indica]|uniref:F-box domain-containing protein n=1 Tax=Canna indica TaxID=4628 RepID=A0AAQ3K888_9LILI|nr:hypothetical protein Cni_G11709 [Canna indica]
MRPTQSRREAQDEARSGDGGRESGREEFSTPPALRATGHLIARIFSQLDCVDLLSCALVCKQWYNDSAELREGWKNEYLEAWNLYGLCIKRETHPPSSTCSIRDAQNLLRNGFFYRRLKMMFIALLKPEPFNKTNGMMPTLGVCSPLPLPKLPTHQNAPFIATVHLRRLHAHALRARVHQPSFWNALARSYASHGAPHLALAVCLHMPSRDAFTFPLAFKLCSLLSAFAEATCLHAHLVKLGLVHTSIHSLNALITFYSNFGHLDLARQLFDRIPNRTVSSWSAMIAAYDRNAQPLEALFTFLGMLEAGVCPDEAALVSTLAACTHGGFLEFGKAIHAYSITCGLGLDSVGFATAVVDLYTKCGELDLARDVFERTAQRNVLTWSAMIGGLAMHGLGVHSIKLFDEMVEAGIKPTSVTMTNVLSACSHAGLVDQGLRLFKLMRKEYGIEPRVEHCGCVVDLLGRAALLDEALEFIRTMPMAATAAIWRSLLGAACTHGNLEVGRLAEEHLTALEEDMVAGDYVMLANLYARLGLWEEVGRVRREMNDMGVRKVAGFSSVEVDGELHRFVMGDKLHPQSQHIQEMLDLLNLELMDQ